MSGGGGGSLLETPTWALATVVFVFICLGLAIEHLIHLICHWLKKRRKNALFEAVEKLKSVLMLLGFMSLILAVTQSKLSKICVPTSVANSMLPCRKATDSRTEKTTHYQHDWTGFKNHDGELGRHQRFLGDDADAASVDSSYYCASKGMQHLISSKGLNELSIFIFVLAVMQIVYSVATMALGRAKMKRWKRWEKETQTTEYMAANDPERFRFTRQTTFGRRHMTWVQTPAQLWIKCFFRQFFHSVAKVDYFTLRHGFISAHLSTTNKTFNFRKYIQRSLEDDFKLVVGISPFMWFVVVIFLLVDVHGWNVFLWLSFLPLIMVLAIGTKLEVVVAKMALRLRDQSTVVRGTPIVEPNDTLFWFSKPHFVLTLVHFTLFMNAFECAFFIWVTLQFGFKSCYHERIEVIVVRLVLAIMVQIVCSYITLPLYALVTQMGTKFKKPVLEEHTVHAIKEWHEEVRKKRNKKQPNASNNPRFPSTSTHDGSEYSSSTTTIRSNTTTTNGTDDLSSSHKTNYPTLFDFNSSSAGEEITHEQKNQEQVRNHRIEGEDDVVEISVASLVDTDGLEIREETQVMGNSSSRS